MYSAAQVSGIRPGCAPTTPRRNEKSAIKDKIIIEGREAILVEENGPGEARTVRRAPVSSLLRYTARVMPPVLPVLPSGARWLCQRRDLMMLVVEHPPQSRTLRVSAGKKGGDEEYHSFRVAFPYIVYVLTFYRDCFEEMKMFYRAAPLAGLTDTLYHTNLPNVRGEPGHYGSQRVCLRYRPELLEGAPLAEATPSLIDFFWSTGFNQDIAASAFERAQGLDPRLNSFASWEAASRDNPLFPLEVNWEPAGRHLPSLWSECLKLHGDTEAPLESAAELADILFRLPVGY